MMEVLERGTADNFVFNGVEVSETGIGWIPTSLDDLCEGDYIRVPADGEPKWGIFYVNRDRDFEFQGIL